MESIETRGDFCISSLAVGECFPRTSDLIAADTTGNLIFVLEGKQVMNTIQVLQSSVTSLIHHKNKGVAELVASDQHGIIIGCGLCS